MPGQMETTKRDRWWHHRDWLAIGIAGAAALFAFIVTVYESIDRMEKKNATKAGYEMLLTEDWDLILRASGDVFAPKSIRVRPYFDLPLSAGATAVGDWVTYDDIRPIIEGDSTTATVTTATVRGVFESVCDQGKVNRQGCGEGIGIKQLEVIFLFNRSQSAPSQMVGAPGAS